MKQKAQKLIYIYHDNKKNVKIILYVLTALVTITWLIVGTFTYWGNNLNNIRTENHASITELNAQLQNLPSIYSLQIGATSGNADGIVNNLQSATDNASTIELSGGTFISLGPSVHNINRLNNNVRSELSKVALRLNEITDSLSAINKFLQYDPKSDLLPVTNGQETDPSERINRTAKGIQDITNELNNLNTKTAKTVAFAISPLASEAENINAKNAPNWYRNVESKQKEVLAIINDEFDRCISESHSTLTNIAHIYLE